jgi:hypothetical protein
MPRVEVIEISDWLVQHSEKLRLQLGGTDVPCSAGRHFASRYVGDRDQSDVFDYLPESMMDRIANVDDFAR